MMNKFLIIIVTLLTIWSYPGKGAITDHKPITEPKLLSRLEQPVYAERQPISELPVPGTCLDWMHKAGVTDIQTAMWLVKKESGCRPTAQNPSSTAYGIMQFLNGTWAGYGCVKTSDPIEQLRCGQKYVTKRYGSWAGAKAWHKSHNWY